MNSFILFSISILSGLILSSSSEINSSSSVGIKLDDKLLNEDSLSFIIFFTEIIKDEDMRNKSFQTCDSEFKNIFINRLNQLEDAIVYRTEILSSDSLISVLFYDDSLKFYKAKFIQNEKGWYLKSLEKSENSEITLFNDLRKYKNRINYIPSCIDKKFIAIFDPYGEVDTIYSGTDVLTYAFSNSFLFYSEKRKLSLDFRYEILGLGSGVGGYILYKNNCLFRYWDASN